MGDMQLTGVDPSMAEARKHGLVMAFQAHA